MRPSNSCNTTDVVIDFGEKEGKDLVVDNVLTVIDSEVDKDNKDNKGKNRLDVDEENVIGISQQSHLDDRNFIFETNDEKKTTGTIAKQAKGNLIEDSKSVKIKEQSRKKIKDEGQEENLTGNRRKFKTIKEIFDDLEKKEKDVEDNSRKLEYPTLKMKENSNKENYEENSPEAERKFKSDTVKVPERKENWLQKLQKEKIKKKLEEKINKEDSTIRKQKILRKKIPTRLMAEDYDMGSVENKKEEDLRKLFKSIREKENLDNSEKKKIITPRKKIISQKRLGKSPGIKSLSVKEMIKKYEEKKN